LCLSRTSLRFHANKHLVPQSHFSAFPRQQTSCASVALLCVSTPTNILCLSRTSLHFHTNTLCLSRTSLRFYAKILCLSTCASAAPTSYLCVSTPISCASALTPQLRPSYASVLLLYVPVITTNSMIMTLPGEIDTDTSQMTIFCASCI